MLIRADFPIFCKCIIYKGILGFCTRHVFSFLHLSSCLVYKRLKSLFLAPLMSLGILPFSCEVVSLHHRSVGAQEVIRQYLFVYKNARASLHLTQRL